MEKDSAKHLTRTLDFTFYKEITELFPNVVSALVSTQQAP